MFPTTPFMVGQLGRSRRAVGAGIAGSRELLLHFNGTNGSTAFTDSSPQGRTVTTVGGAQLSTTDPLFGTACGLFDGSGDYLTVPDAVGFRPGAAEFCIDVSVRIASTGSSQVIVNKGTGTSFFGYQLWFNASSGRFGFRGCNSATTLIYASEGISAASTGVWYALRGCRTGDTMRFFIDGVQQSFTNIPTATVLYENSATLSIGAYNDGVAGFNGKLDEFRYTSGSGLTNANYTIASAEFPDT